MKVGKAIYNILSQSTEVQSNFPFNTTDYSPTGTELVTNGDFSSGSSWTLGPDWSIANGKLNGINVTNTSLGTDTTQTGFAFAEKSFKVVYTISNYSQGEVNILLGGYKATVNRSSNGTFTENITINSANTTLYIQGINSFTGSIDNISVEEMVLNKIFPELAPPGVEVPYIVYSVVSNSPSETKNTNGDIDTASIEVYGFQDTYNKAVDLGVSVRAALDRKTGTYNTIEIQSTNYVNEQMDVNEARKLWAAIQDYSIRIKNI